MILTEKNGALLNSEQEFIEIEAWLFTQTIKFYTFNCRIV